MRTTDTGYLTISRISGEPERLLAGYRRSSAVMAGVGRDHGLIFHAAAKADEGLMIVNLWPSEEGSESAASDSRRLGVVDAHDLRPEQIRPEHYQVANAVLFES